MHNKMIYRGEIGIELENIGPEPFVLKRYAKVAQLVLCPVLEAIPKIVDELDETDRGAAGYGSTGSMIKEESQFRYNSQGATESKDTVLGKTTIDTKCSMGCDFCNGGCH